MVYEKMYKAFQELLEKQRANEKNKANIDYHKTDSETGPILGELNPGTDINDK
jgi:hypothetical protein